MDVVLTEILKVDMETVASLEAKGPMRVQGQWQTAHGRQRGLLRLARALAEPGKAPSKAHC